jgi:menaquinone-specific isochorismate synthase
MEIIETQRHRSPNREELRLFLEAVRDAAEEDAHFKIASISLSTRRLDPLAVLESIYERDEFHFYVEKPSEDRALAGAEAVVLGRFEGADRFAEVRAWAEEILEHTVAVGDLEAYGSGPHFYAGFTFEDEASPQVSFAPATLFLPRWQVARRGMETTAVANFRVDAEASIEALEAKIWAAYEKFSTFTYEKVEPEPPKSLLSQTEVGPADGYQARVSEALKRIEAGHYDKIVMARAVDQVYDRVFNPLHTLNGMRARFRECFAFSFENDLGQSFIGATPERLARVEAGELQTEALAGSVGRSANAREDAMLAQSLLQSDKDLREHRHVIGSIQRRLARLGLEAKAADEPALLILPNVQHLRTPITAQLGDEQHILDVIAELHPTPAVGGVPREKAVPDIAELEPFSRGLYAGVLGYFDHRGDGEFCVGLRAGLVDGVKARLFAGAGIVAGSDPEKEFRETELKLSALRDALRG